MLIGYCIFIVAVSLSVRCVFPLLKGECFDMGSVAAYPFQIVSIVQRPIVALYCILSVLIKVNEAQPPVFLRNILIFMPGIVYPGRMMSALLNETEKTPVRGLLCCMVYGWDSDG